MQYMGGKARIAKKLTEVMLSMTTERTFYLEPFMGAASMLVNMAPNFSAPAAGDVMPDVVLMWQAVQQGWVPPAEMSRERYDWLKTQQPSPERAFAGFGCSFSGKWFGGLDATPGRANRGTQTAAQIAYNSITTKRPALTGVFIHQGDYRQWIPGPGTVVYCDPPYTNTTGYGGTDPFLSGLFWATMERWTARGATVFVSEYVAPLAWRCVWEFERKVTAGSDKSKLSTEKLFTL